MTLKEEYFMAVANHEYDRQFEILIKNLITCFDFKSVCDLGTCLCDADNSGITVNLNRNDCEELGKKLLVYSYYSNPDVYNAFALQIVCLERNSDFEIVIDMTESAMLLHNGSIMNNIAYANYKSGNINTAFCLQNQAVEFNNEEDKNDILNYNLMLYDLFLNVDVKQKYNHERFLNMLISDDTFDYESAIVLATFFDDYNFVKNNISFFKETFICDSNVENLINDYTVYQKSPTVKDLERVLIPKTVYGKNFYLGKE